jgi:hypothetical protein
MEDLQATQFDSLVSSGERTLVMLYADWCPFCQQFKPPFESTTNSKRQKGYTLYGAKVN